MSAERKRGSFFKLIESFAIELGTLKKEMGHRSRDPTESVDQDVGGLFPHGSPGSGRCSGVSSGPSPSPSGPSGLRDSGYSGSLHRKLTVLERLIHTHSVWLQLTLDQQGALQLLQTQPPGTFVVRRSSSLQRKVLCVRMDSDSVPVQEFSVSESQYSFSLEDSALRFADVFRLVAFCCISRDVLPFILKLPEPIASARTRTELDHISKQGPGFWDTCKRKTSSVPPPLPPPSKTITDLTISTISAPLNLPKIYTRTPSELECSQSNGALCFINPLFVKVHHEDRETSQIATTPDPEGGDGDAKLDQFSKDTSQSPRSPCPPRPPPPRFFNAKLSRAQSMPEKVQWVKEKPEGRDRKNREGSFLSRLSSSLSISPSSSPPTKISHISSPISIPNQTAVLSLAAFSSSPRRVFQMSPSSSSQEDAAMEDHIIERALRRARLRRVRLQRTGTSKDKDEAGDANANGRQDGESQMDVTDAGRNGGQRLSDLSLSTDSSDSLDFSQSSSFFFPPMHDPKPPTLAEIDAHLPMSLPQFCTSLDYDEDEEEDYEEEDYGVSLESDQEEQEQDQDVTMEPPGRRGGRHRGSASAVVIQKALKGQLRKMSGVFNSLLTPEKRAVRRVLELSRDKRTYFGGLVQDFLGYMSDQGQEQGLGLGLDSASELLQTVRQFLTQMKSYLRQSSELEPPIESLIPEEQIDLVLEKAMHKCVLKPLKPVLSSCLHQSMVRSGAWSQLKDNMAAAKNRPPAEMGVTDALSPDPLAIDKIRHKIQAMCKLYSPEKKVHRLLQVCKQIYTIMEDHSGRLFGADDFLPMLTYVLAQCELPQMEAEVLYMMELLEPTLLNGEGGYYLTSAFGAMSLIKNLEEEQAARVLSSQTRDTLHQWHRRRTMQRTAPSIDDFQNFLRVALQEQDSGCTAKTLRVHPQATVEEVCSLCALKFCVREPEQYRLFLTTGGSSQQLTPDSHTQRIKAELHTRDAPDTFHFVYRRVDFQDTSSQANEANDANNANANTTTARPETQSDLSPKLSLSLPQSNIHSVSI
ncbi:unnamed protein product [Knipowitschia caucasica]